MITVMLASGPAARGAGRSAGAARSEPARRAGPAHGASPGRRTASSRSLSMTVGIGDRLVVGAGEVVPVDGRLLSAAMLDESALTGEPLPVERVAGDDVRSGVVNAGQPFELRGHRGRGGVHLRGRRPARRAGSGLLGTVRADGRPVRGVLRSAHACSLAGAAWAFSGDPVRAVAVLVVATPCPLLLAAPIAIMSGLSRAARVGRRHQGWWRTGAAGRRAGHAVRQDRHPDPGTGPALADVITAATGSTPTRCCGSPPRWTRSRRTCWPARSSPRRTRRGLALQLPTEVVRGARLRPARAGGRASGPAGQGGLDRGRRPARTGCGRCAGAPTWTAR